MARTGKIHALRLLCHRVDVRVVLLLLQGVLICNAMLDFMEDVHLLIVDAPVVGLLCMHVYRLAMFCSVNQQWHRVGQSII